jgi:hypothetical protein
MEKVQCEAAASPRSLTDDDLLKQFAASLAEGNSAPLGLQMELLRRFLLATQKAKNN